MDATGGFAYPFPGLSAGASAEEAAIIEQTYQALLSQIIRNNNEAQAFLSRGGQVIVRMRGLPYDCTAKQILDFFAQSDNPIQVLNNEEGILFVKKPDGRATGDAFVLFATEEAAFRALDKHREIIGARYIELFRSSTAEVQQVLNRTMETPYLESQVPPATTSPLLGNLPQVPLMPPPWLQGPQVQMARKDCIRLRGLPYEAQVEHIVDFLGKFATNIAYQGVHMVHNAQGQPSGEAFIQMDSEQSAFLTASQRHHRYLVIDKKQRYIEVFQCSLEDMLLVLQGVQGQPTASNPVSALAAAPAPDLGWSDPFGRISALRSRIASLGPVPPLHLPPLYSKYPSVAAAAAAVASVTQNGPNRVSPTSALNRVSPLLLPSFPLPMLLSQATPPQYYPTTAQQQQAAVAAAASLSHLVSQQNGTIQ